MSEPLDASIDWQPPPGVRADTRWLEELGCWRVRLYGDTHGETLFFGPDEVMQADGGLPAVLDAAARRFLEYGPAWKRIGDRFRQVFDKKGTE